MTFTPLAPTTRVPPSRIADDTWIIHSVQLALGEPLFIYLNSMVILGAEPMIVDTGTVANRAQWLEDVFSLVEPEDVRWIFLSHDDVDHAGNLDEILTACPNARLVCNWAMMERHTNCFGFPLERCQWVMDGESLDVGDRTLHAVRPRCSTHRPPAVCSTRRPACTGRSTPSRHRCRTRSIGVADLDGDFWDFGMGLFALGAVSPWLSMVDEAKYGSHVDRVQSLDITTIASCHSPVIEGEFIERAFARVRELPTLDPPVLPDQSALDQIVAATSQPQT